MIREIVHDPLCLARKSIPANKEDITIADDLLDTLQAHSEHCVGMAANMIGEWKCIIVFAYEGGYMEMFNPQIIKQWDRYDTEEGCLSLKGSRKTQRYRKIKVEWQTREFKTRIQTFTGFPAQIIQHEIDHCQGILI